eukprot:scaffold1442_cov128-Cylindrotheca_fusiformis.AAC.12
MTTEPSNCSSCHSATSGIGKRPTSTARRDPITHLRPYDILSGRCREARNNIGNRRFRVTIEMNLSAYQAAPTKTDRSVLIDSLVRMLRDDVGARFLKKEWGHYVELGEMDARKKVAHALRDMSRTDQKQHESNIKMERKISRAVAMTLGVSKTTLNKPPLIAMDDCLPNGCSIPNLRLEQEPMRDQSSEEDFCGWLSDLFS